LETDKAQDLLNRVHELHLRELEAKARLKRDIEEDYRGRLESIRIEKATAARQALAAGVTKGEIGRATGTLNYTSIDALLDYRKDVDGG
jgi:hypothetical protein